MNTTKRPVTQRGFSLLELLLTVGVFAVLMLAIAGILQDYAKREISRSTIKYMENVAKAMDQILSDPDNFNALYNAAKAAGGGYQLIADTTAAAPDNITKNFTVSGVTIQGSRLLSKQFQAISPLRTQVRILLHISDNRLIETDTRALESIIITTQPKPDDIVQMAANTATAHGGWVRTYSGKNTAVIQSAFGSWAVAAFPDLQATNWYSSSLRANLNSRTQGSYLAYYTYHNLEDKTGDYLYRHEDLDTAGKRNTMYGPLNIGGNDIIGADNVTINGTEIDCATEDDPDAKGVLCVNGTAIVKGNTFTGGNMIAYGSAAVADSMNAKSMRVQNALTNAKRTTYGASGLFVVDGTSGNQDTIAVTNNAIYQDGLTSGAGVAKTITGTTATVPSGYRLRTGTITNTQRITSTTISAKKLTVDDKLKVGEVRSGSMNVSGKTGVLDITNSDNLIYNKPIVAPLVNVNRLNVSSFGKCNSGCGE